MQIQAWITLGIFITILAIIGTGKLSRSVAALLGAAFLMVTQLLPADVAVRFIDFNTIGLLMGMMIVVGVLSKTGIFQYIAIKSLKMTKGNWLVTVFAITLTTAVLSGVLDNVTTVLLISPIILSLADIMKFNPVPLLISEAIASNIGGTATLIGDPPNIIIGSHAHFSFMDFIVNLTPITFVVLFVTVGIIALIYKRDFKIQPEEYEKILKVDENAAVKNILTLKKALIITGFILIGFLSHGFLHVEAAVIALMGASLLLAIIPDNGDEIIHKDIEWPTLIFFAGLFIIVGALKETGVISALSNILGRHLHGHPMAALLTVLWFSGLTCAFVNNIGFTATFVYVIDELAGQVGMPSEPLFWALALGACLGGNGSFLGAAANVVIADVANRFGYPITFKAFMKTGMLSVFIAMILCSIYLVIRYRAFL